MGSLFTTTEIEVPLGVSGLGARADMTFQTSDSEGGWANWKAL